MSDTQQIKVLGISGSLRKGSYNSAALREAQRVSPAGIQIEIADIAQIPLYNDDVRVAGFPAPVEHLIAQIRAADAVLFVTPEYNYSVPGVLKNAIDWVSRAPEQPLAGKPAAVMGVSPGRLGTARAQYHLRQIMVFLDAHLLNKPEVMIGNAGQLFDADGALTDEATRGYIVRLLEALREWTIKLS